MATTMSVSDARAALSWIVARVSEGDEVTLTRHGQPVAVVVRPDVLRSHLSGYQLPAVDGEGRT